MDRIVTNSVSDCEGYLPLWLECWNVFSPRMKQETINHLSTDVELNTLPERISMSQHVQRTNKATVKIHDSTICCPGVVVLSPFILHMCITGINAAIHYFFVILSPSAYAILLMCNWNKYCETFNHEYLSLLLFINLIPYNFSIQQCVLYMQV